MSGIMRAFKLTILIFLNLIFLIIGLLIEVSFFVEKKNRLKIKAFIMSLWAKLCCRILGINVSVNGQPGSGVPYFIASNHCSYADIFVIGSVTPSVFLSKSEVASWPLAGWLAKLGGTVFVKRESRFETPKVISEIKERLNKGVSIVIFPEGTTNDGINIKKFNSTFFKIPAETGIPVLPVSISYTSINGNPLSTQNKDNVAWHSDMKFAPHFWNLLIIKNIEAVVCFNPIIEHSCADRKELCAETYKAVVSGLTEVKQ